MEELTLEEVEVFRVCTRVKILHWNTFLPLQYLCVCVVCVIQSKAAVKTMKISSKRVRTFTLFALFCLQPP